MPRSKPQDPPLSEADRIALVAALDNHIEFLKRWRRRVAETYLPNSMTMFADNASPLAYVTSQMRNDIAANTTRGEALAALAVRLALAAEHGRSMHAHPLEGP